MQKKMVVRQNLYLRKDIQAGVIQHLIFTQFLNLKEMNIRKMMSEKMEKNISNFNLNLFFLVLNTSSNYFTSLLFKDNFFSISLFHSDHLSYKNAYIVFNFKGELFFLRIKLTYHGWWKWGGIDLKELHNLVPGEVIWVHIRIPFGREQIARNKYVYLLTQMEPLQLVENLANDELD